jgi:hypothetical protein
MRSVHSAALQAIAALAITISSTAAFAQAATSAQPNPAADALAAARASLNKVLNAPSPSGDAFKKLSELKTHYIALEKAASAASPEWSTHFTAIDRLVSELIGTPSSSAPAAVGTSGRTGAQTSATLDASLRANLQEFRTHLTAFSAAMSAVAPPKSSPAVAETSPPDAAAAQTAAAQTATIEGKPSTPAQPAPSTAPPAIDLDRVTALVDSALTNAPDSSGKVSVDRATLEQIKKELEELRAQVK